ncbi:MAG: 16S rRNA (adenine(1518)-N(6)/adenine(1519)-N(6))-dimethyltransferase RsmA [Actinomycetes bacterium]
MLGPDEVRELLDRHGLAARRSLGQNFVADPGVVAWIAEQAGTGPGDRVVEVGPGLGSLTLALAGTGAHVLALEKDESLVPVLRHVLRAAGVAEGEGDGEVDVRSADALKVDWSELLGAGAAPGSWTLVANLPYNVAVPVVMSVLAGAPAVGRLVVMVQKEVADRLAAGPGGRTIGLPSLRTAWYGRARVLGDVPPEAFVPQPRVVSSVVSVERHAPPSVLVGPDDALGLAERAYHQRRKMLRATLGGHLPDGALEAAGIDPCARPESLSVGDWARLAEVVAVGDGA